MRAGLPTATRSSPFYPTGRGPARLAGESETCSTIEATTRRIMKRFQGRTVLITGAGSGIGRATAERFGSEGGAVVCADLNEAGVNETAAAIRAQGGEALALKCDVS